jgi:hypothetical protein
MKSAPLGWPLLSGVVLNTLVSVQARGRARGHALQAVDALARAQITDFLFIDLNAAAEHRKFQA